MFHWITTYREYNSVLELGKILITLFTEVFSTATALSHFLVAVWTGAGLVEAALLTGKGHSALAVEIVWLLIMAQIQFLDL